MTDNERAAWLELADEYEAGLRKMEAAGYEEFSKVIPKHKMVIAALRASNAGDDWSCSSCGDRDVPEKFRVFGKCYRCAAQQSIDVALERLKFSIDARLNAVLCEMKPDYDDSIVGFNEAWDIVRKAFKEYIERADSPAETAGK